MRRGLGVVLVVLAAAGCASTPNVPTRAERVCSDFFTLANEAKTYTDAELRDKLRSVYERGKGTVLEEKLRLALETATNGEMDAFGLYLTAIAQDCNGL